MKSHFKIILLLPLLGIIAGCSTIGEMAASARATRSNIAVAYAENFCKATISNKPDTDRQADIDSCTKDMYGRLMAKSRTGSSVYPVGSSTTGQKVYRADECIGAVVNGQCHGSIIPKGYAPTCYGTMLNGQCTGPMF